MRTKIYTKGGDKGETSLFGGPRVSKSIPQLAAYGSVDELNSSIGFCRSFSLNSQVKQLTAESLFAILAKIQNEMFNVGSHLACGDEKLRAQLPQLSETLIAALEQEIDRMTEKLPELREFILPGGHPLASALHISRTVCRRAEREVIEYFSHAGIIDNEWSNTIVMILNRLSDFLFTAARFANHIHQIEEAKWQK